MIDEKRVCTHSKRATVLLGEEWRVGGAACDGDRMH